MKELHHHTIPEYQPLEVICMLPHYGELETLAEIQ